MGTAAIDRRAVWEWAIKLWQARAAAAAPCLRLRLQAALYELDQRIGDFERGECPIAAVRHEFQRLRAITDDSRSKAPRSVAPRRGV
jgi:hypothetical protein